MTRTATKVTAAAIYCRLSTDRDGDSIGIERQESLCRELAASKGWPVAQVYCDRNISAYAGKRRPAFEQMLTDLRDGDRDAVLVVDQDRLTRRPLEMESFI